MTLSDHSADVATRRYRLAPDVIVQVITAREDVARHFEDEYGSARIAGEASEGHRIDVIVDDFDSVTSRGNWLSRRGRHKTITWRVAVRDVDEQVTSLAFEGGGSMAISFLQTFYLEPLLRLKTLQTGSSLVHGCTILDGGTSCLMTGGSGVGKTTIVLQRALAGFPVQGDNYVILNRQGETLAYPRRLRLYANLIRENPDVFRMLPKRERTALRWHRAVKFASRGLANMPRRIPLHDIFPALPEIERAPLGKLVLLQRSDSVELRGPERISNQAFIERTVATNEAEADRLLPLLAGYAERNPKSILNRASEIDRELLESASKGLEACSVLVPRTRQPSVQAERICNLVCS